MGKYIDISTKKMKDNSIAIMARITYLVKNLTKIYGIETKREGSKKIIGIKALLVQGIEPFITSDGTLNDMLKGGFITQEQFEYERDRLYS